MDWLNSEARYFQFMNPDASPAQQVSAMETDMRGRGISHVDLQECCAPCWVDNVRNVIWFVMNDGTKADVPLPIVDIENAQDRREFVRLWRRYHGIDK